MKRNYIQKSATRLSPGEPIAPPGKTFYSGHTACATSSSGQNIFFLPANEMLRPANPYSSARRPRGGPRQKQDQNFPTLARRANCSAGRLLKVFMGKYFL